MEYSYTNVNVQKTEQRGKECSTHEVPEEAIPHIVLQDEMPISDFEDYNIEDSEISIISYGCTSRAVYETVAKAEEKGIKIGFVRLRTIWPFPDKIIRKLAENTGKIIVPELNLGQVSQEVERVANGLAEVIPLNKIGGGELITPEEILAKIQEEVKRNE